MFYLFAFILSYLINIREKSTPDLVHIEVIKSEEIGHSMPDSDAREKRETERQSDRKKERQKDKKTKTTKDKGKNSKRKKDKQTANLVLLTLSYLIYVRKESTPNFVHIEIV
jgi:hypothetical protein